MSLHRMSDWILKLKSINTNFSKQLINNKEKDTKRLLDSGLPMFNSYMLPFSNFSKKNLKLLYFLNKYDAFFIRIWPRVKGVSRERKKDLKTFQECYNFLLDKIIKGRECDYDIHLGEYEKPLWSGTIISNANKVIIEIGIGEHVELEHGKIIPIVGIYDGYGSMKYDSKNFKADIVEKFNQNLLIEAKKIIWQALAYIKTHQSFDNIPKYTFKKGYFCFVYTKDTHRIIFIDYKDNDSYLF